MVKLGRVFEAVVDLGVVVASDPSNKVAVRELANANKLLAENAAVDHDDSDDGKERSREEEQEGTTGDQHEEEGTTANAATKTTESGKAGDTPQVLLEGMAGTVVDDSQQSPKTLKQMQESLHLADIRETASRYACL